jgi:hypothetical protein
MEPLLALALPCASRMGARSASVHAHQKPPVYQKTQFFEEPVIKKNYVFQRTFGSLKSFKKT